MKKLILLTFAIIFTLSARSQIKPDQVKSITIIKSTSNKAITKEPIIDSIRLICIYETREPESDLNQTKTAKEDQMMLQIGNDKTKYFSYKTFVVDSLLRNVNIPEQRMAIINKNKYGTHSVIYHNYPLGKLTVNDNILDTYYSFEEDIPEIEWIIGEQTRTILDYKCTKAECNFRGRQYSVWFTSEIPVSAGPWKFYGLPGLILAYESEDGDYAAEIIGIKNNNDKMIYTDRMYIKTSRKKFLKQLYSFKSDSLGYLINYTGSKVELVDGAVIAPAKLSYDLQETDYK